MHMHFKHWQLPNFAVDVFSSPFHSDDAHLLCHSTMNKFTLSAVEDSPTSLMLRHSIAVLMPAVIGGLNPLHVVREIKLKNVTSSIVPSPRQTYWALYRIHAAIGAVQPLKEGEDTKQKTQKC